MTRYRPFRHLGTISEGTLSPEDVIPKLAYTLRQQLRYALPRDLANDVRWLDEHTYDGDDTHDPGEIWDALIGAIQCVLPPYLYCGALDGDGADIGIWPDHDAIAEDRRTGELPDADALPAGYRGLALSVSDHGNMMLLRCFKNGARWEVWSCV